MATKHKQIEIIYNAITEKAVKLVQEAITDKIDVELFVKKKASEKVIKELEDKYMDQIEKQMKNMEQTFVNGLRNKQNAIPDMMECAICHGLIFKPQFCAKCGTTIFCTKCVEDYQKREDNEKKDKCPSCDEKLEPKKLIPMMQQVFNNQKLMIPGAEEPEPDQITEVGAKREMLYKEIDEFFKEKVPKTVQCPQNCGQSLESMEQAKAHFSECRNSKVMCKACYELIENQEDQMIHDETCQLLKIDCPMNCGLKIKRKDLDKHLERYCTEGQQKCNNCGMMVLKKNMMMHQEECMQQLFKQLGEQCQIIQSCPQSKTGAHSIKKCGCSRYCCKCMEFIKIGKEVQIQASPCGLFCMHCEMTLDKKHKGFEYRPGCALICSDCNVVHLDYGHPVKQASCGCLICYECKEFLNGGNQGVITSDGCAYCLKCKQSVSYGHDVVGDPECSLYCQKCEKIIYKKHELVANEKGCNWCNTCEKNVTPGHDIFGDPNCGTYCNTCKKKVVTKHNWYTSNTGCAFCTDCNKSISPGHEIVGKYGCGLFCVTCSKVIYRNHSYFRATKCAILCDTDEHNVIYKQLMVGHNIVKDGHRYWDCKDCNKKLNYSDWE